MRWSLLVSILGCCRSYPVVNFKIIRISKNKFRNLFKAEKDIFFSMGDKEMLIKSVVYAIPTFVMGCFRLPTGFCKDIMRFCAEFW